MEIPQNPGRDAPAGELLGAFQEGGARLLLKRTAGSGFVELVQVPVPAEGAPWGAEIHAVVAYVRELAMVPWEEQSCGLSDERYASLVGVGGDEAALIAASGKKIHSYRFHAEKGADYRVICGSCPPMALERRPDGLGLFVPVRRALTPARIDVPLGFERGRSERSAMGACTASRLAVLYEANGEILVQQREEGSWRLGPAKVLARTDERGAPTEPSLLGIGEHLIALWRRKAEGRVRIEALAL